jgi:spire-like protein
MQVIHELRHGVKLRKVSELYINRRNIEYELTPFEILLDQIRAKRYHLKKVPVDTLNNELKKDARDIILEFIRSRPPLKKTSLRNLNNTKIKNEPLNLHEQLMNSIRNYSTPLRKISTQKINNDVNLYKYCDESLNKSNIENKKKRLLKPDKKLLNNLTSSDDVKFFFM